MNSDQKLVPIGAMPEYIWIEHRVNHLWEAIQRYANEGLEIPEEWIKEHNCHCRWLKERRLNGRN